MPGSLGTIRGQIRLDVASAIAGYAAVRAANASTINTMNDARQRMKGFGVAAVAMGAGFLTGFGMAVSAASDFEKKLDYFGAVNNATAGEMEKVRAKALELGKTTVYSASQIADALVEMGKAGVSAKDITDGMADAMVNLAQAADIDLAQATNIVTSQIQAYSLSAKDAKHVTDLMAGAANASIIDVTDIGVSMKYVAGVAHSLGISIDSTTDAISLLGKAGIKGSTAGTSLRQIMVSLAGGTNKAKGVLKELGIITEDGANKFFDASGKAKSLAEVFQILQEHTADLTDKERLMAMRTIFNNRALAAASILTKEGAAGFAEMNAEISKTTAAEVAGKRMDNLAGDIRRLKGSFETFLIEGGTPFQSFLRQIVQGITSLVDWFARLPRGLQTGIFTFMLVAGVLLTLAGTVALMGAAFTGAIGALKSVGGAFKLLGSILMTVTRATWAMTAAALANPYVWIAIAVIALVAAMVLLYQKNEAFRNAMDATGRWLKKAWQAVVDFFKGLPDFFVGLWGTISQAFSDGVDWVVRKWGEMVDWITSAPGKIGTAISNLTSTVINFVTAVPGMVGDALAVAWTAFLNFMADLPENMGYLLGLVLGTLTRWAINAYNWATETGANVYNAITTWFAELPGRISDYLSQLWADFQTWAVNFVVSAMQFGIDTYNGIKDWFAKLPERIANYLVNTATKAKEQWDKTVQWAKDFGSRALDAVVQYFSQLPGKVRDQVYSMAGKAKEQWDKAVGWAKNAGKSIYNGVIDYFVQMPGKTWDIIGKVLQAFKDMVANAFNAAKSFAKGLWDGFKDGLGIHSPSFIEHAMWAITDVAEEETKRLKAQVKGMQGLARGLQEVHDTAAQAGATPEWASQAARSLKNTREMASLFSNEGRVALMSGASKGAPALSSSSDLEAARELRPINVTVNNPIAERASDSAARKLRSLSEMGAF